MTVELLWLVFLILFNVIVAPVSTMPRWRKDVLTENIFQTPLLFGSHPVYWYLGYLSDPPLFYQDPPPYHLELESTFLPWSWYPDGTVLFAICWRHQEFDKTFQNGFAGNKLWFWCYTQGFWISSAFSQPTLPSLGP